MPLPRGQPDAEIGTGGEETINPPTTALLTRLGREGDRQSFASLYHHYAPRLRQYLLAHGMARDAADEVLQETMLTVWHKAGSFDPARGNASAWVFTIARSRLVDRVRRDRRAAALQPAAPGPCPEPTSAEVAPGGEPLGGGAVLRQALEALPHEQLRILRAAYIEGLSFSTIAAREGIPLGTVKTRARLALARLRKTLGAGEDPAPTPPPSGARS